MRLYHFTHPGHLPSILSEGVLRPTDPNLSMTDTTVGPQVVWLTDQPELVDVGFRDGLYSAKREIRFEVDVRGVRWLDWQPALTGDQDWREIIIRTGGGEEQARHWYVYPGPIAAKRWRSVTEMTTGKSLWVPEEVA